MIFTASSSHAGIIAIILEKKDGKELHVAKLLTNTGVELNHNRPRLVRERAMVPDTGRAALGDREAEDGRVVRHDEGTSKMAEEQGYGRRNRVAAAAWRWNARPAVGMYMWSPRSCRSALSDAISVSMLRRE